MRPRFSFFDSCPESLARKERGAVCDFEKRGPWIAKAIRVAHTAAPGNSDANFCRREVCRGIRLDSEGRKKDSLRLSSVPGDPRDVPLV